MPFGIDDNAALRGGVVVCGLGDGCGLSVGYGLLVYRLRPAFG